MLTLLRAVVVAATLLWAGGGVAAADPASLDDVAQSAATVDGWQVSAALTRMTIITPSRTWPRRFPPVRFHHRDGYRNPAGRR